MKKENSGFTLIELICVIAILGLITVSIFSFILSGMGMAKETKKSMALSENARTTINKMKTDIMNCSGGVVGADPAVDTFFLMTRDGTAPDGVNDTYTISCYRYVQGDGKIYFGRAKNIAITNTLDSSILEKCSPTHVLCDNVSSFTATVVKKKESVEVTKSDGSTDTKTQIKAKRVHIVLSLEKDNKDFDTQQDAAIRSDARYFQNFADAAAALAS